MIENVTQQVGLLPTLEALTTEGALTVDKGAGLLFPSYGLEPAAVQHTEGGNRDLVHVFRDGGDATIKLSGDDTAPLTGADPALDRIIDLINYKRIRGDERI